MKSLRPKAQGLYDPQFDHESCGVGFVVNIKGKRSHEIVRQGLNVLLNIHHRGATGAEPNTGDGAGILMQVPHSFLKIACAVEGFQLPSPGEYGVGMVFLPPHPKAQKKCEQLFEQIVAEEEQTVLGWRTVPTRNQTLGETARDCQPVVRQVFIGRNTKIQDDSAFERKLYVIRKLAENKIRYAKVHGGDYFYIVSLSYKTITYKGMLMCKQVDEFYPDLSDPSVESALALVHSRFSTNTFPSWDRAHPYRYLVHNVEYPYL